MSDNTNDEQRIDFSQLFGLKTISSEYGRFGNDYVYSRITTPASMPPQMRGPLRVSGVSTVFCRGGRIQLDVNLNSYTLEPNTMINIGSDSIVTIRNVDWEGLDAAIFIMSPEFLHDINFDISVINTSSFDNEHSPLIGLEPAEMDVLCRYLDIIHYNTTTDNDTIYIRAISRCVVAAMFYQALAIVRRRLGDRLGQQPGRPLRPGSRRTGYVRDFLKLVHEHHRRERSVAFYASKLFISPKYLSMVIKEATGRSAVDWIDQYVMLEAKNLLRFSGKSVQQIAYELNFNNQSSFGKYFKNLAGMSPTEFQRS